MIERREVAVSYRLLKLVLLLVVLVAGGASSEEVSTPAGVFFETKEVPLVSLDVSVVDSDGKPVPGLTGEDFTVLEDGKPVQISNFFSNHPVERLRSSHDTVELEQEPRQADGLAGDQSQAAAASGDPNQSLTLVVYIDESILSRSRRQAMLENLRSFFDQTLPKDLQVMLVSYGDAIEIRQPLVNDPELVLAAIEGMEDTTVTGFDVHRAPILRSFRSLITSRDGSTTLTTRLTSDIEFVMKDIERYASMRAQRARQCLASLKALIRSLSGLPGRKVVLYFAVRTEMRPGEDMFTIWERAFPTLAGNYRSQAESSRETLQGDVDAVVELANAYRVSLYTMSTPEDELVTEGSAEFYGFESSSELESLPSSSKEVLTVLASGTGGRALTDNAKLGEHLVEVAQELGSCYSLGYRPDEDRIGYHRVAVTVKRDGLELRHREGYRVSTIEERMADRTLSAALHGASENPLGISVEASDGKLAADGSYSVPILVRVPLGKLVLLPQQANHLGKVSVFATARDLSGTSSAVQHRQYPVEIPNNQLLSAITQEAGFAMAVSLGAGEQVVAVGVRDDLANVEALVTLDIDVGEMGE